MKALPSFVAVMLAVIVVGAASTGTVHADEAVPAKARNLVDRGRRAHDRGDYSKAIALFNEAYVLAPSDGLLFNLAQSYRMRGSCEDAAVMYKRFLANDPPAESAAIASAHLETVENCARVVARPEPIVRPAPVRPIAVVVPAKPIAPTSPPVVVAKPLRPLVEPGPHTEVQMTDRRKAEIGLAIGGSAALGVALIYALDARAAERDVEALYAKGAKWRDVEPTHARGERDALTAKLFGAAGLLAVGSAVTLYVLDRREERNAATLSVVPTRRGGQVSLSWGF